MQIFRSIRYARAERFRPPVAEKGAIKAETAVCPQRESRLGGVMGPMLSGNPLSEDCLRVSVFTPSIQGKYPVMVWICGGAFVTGSGEFSRYDASRLCEEGNIVVVNISYRVGALGFLYQPETGGVNLGIEDQICALEWIREHVAEYGGDPSDITACGQSAGAYSIAAIIGRGRTDLFSKAILFSAPLSMTASEKNGNRVRRCFMKHLSRVTGCKDRQDETALKASCEDILAAQAAMIKELHHPLPFCPVNEKLLPESKGHLEKVMITCLKDDARPFVPFRCLTGIATRLIFTGPMHRYAEHMRGLGVDVTEKVFTWHPDNNGIGACHTLEIPFMLGDWECWNRANMLAGLSEEEFYRRGGEFRKCIAAFVRG